MIHIAGEMAIINRPYRKICPGARFSKVPKTLRARKAVRKSPTHLFCKSGLFICCKGNKNENNFKVSCLETLSFSRYKENYVTRNAPEKFRDFRETGPWIASNKMQHNVCKHHDVSPHTFTHIHHHCWREIRSVKVTKCSPNSTPPLPKYWSRK